MKSIIIGLLILVNGNVAHNDVKRATVDKTELNNFYDENGRRVFSADYFFMIGTQNQMLLLLDNGNFLKKNQKFQEDTGTQEDM